MKNKRRNHSAQFKAKVTLRAPSVPTALTHGDESTLKMPVFCLDNG